jgi:hypothetical protein
VINRLRAQGLRRPVRVSSHRTPEPQRISTIPCRSAVDRLRPFVMVELRIRRSVRVYLGRCGIDDSNIARWLRLEAVHGHKSPAQSISSAFIPCQMYVTPPLLATGGREISCDPPSAPVSAVMVRLILSKVQTIVHGEACGQRCSTADEVVCLRHGRARAG